MAPVMRVVDQLNSGPTDSDPQPPVIAAFRGRTVLITGAAGSIGSELSRQVCALPVAGVVLLDRDENSMFELTRSLSAPMNFEGQPQATIIPVLGDIRDVELVRNTFAQWRPHIVLHAAAYKHVPMMEASPCEAVLNNVTGTRILADTAIQFSCERFLLISTDKAVEPASVMGATKRLAELLMQQSAATAGAADKGPVAKTVLASVRFVNVIGSRGSVVPIFQQQIEAGGPVTITDGEMTRFFMSVERAACLLLKVATLSESGCIYALETGEPVKIADLAREMIEAAGLVPGKDIAVEITGVRPGEKISERLHSERESISPTVFRGIDRVHSSDSPNLDRDQLEELEAAANRRDSERVIAILREMPLDYRSSSIESTTSEPIFTLL